MCTIEVIMFLLVCIACLLSKHECFFYIPGLFSIFLKKLEYSFSENSGKPVNAFYFY